MTRFSRYLPTTVMMAFLMGFMLAQIPYRVYADDDRDKHSDQDRARQALERGEVRPLAEILDITGSQIDGEIVETELEKEHGRWIYEIKYITKSGRMKEIHIKALSGRIIKHDDD